MNIKLSWMLELNASKSCHLGSKLLMKPYKSLYANKFTAYLDI